MAVHNAVGGNSRPRELRRRVMLGARVRSARGWSNACILNVSSRGLMINAGAPSALTDGSIELWHGEHMIVATVVWRKGSRAGLRTEFRLPVDDMLASVQGATLQLTAGQLSGDAPRPKPSDPDRSRLRARAMELCGVLAIAATLAVGALGMVERAFARPLIAVQAALNG